MTPLLMASVLAGCAAGTLQAGPEPTEELPSSKATRVEVVTLEPGEARLELDLPGEVGGDRDANLAAANGGYVEKVLVTEGESVHEGQAIAYIDTGLYRAQLDQAEAQLAQADADLRRIEALGDLASPAQLQGAQTQARVAEATVKQARNRMSRAIVRAPFDGVVASVGVEKGEAVSPGAAVVRVVQLHPAVVNLSVSDRDVVSLEPGMPVTVTSSSRTGTYEGVVARVSPAADLRTRSFPVEIEIPNEDRRLMPGMIARVRIERSIAESATVVPQNWIVTLRDRRGVFVVAENTAMWRDVVLGEVIHDKVVIESGIEPGDRLVITGHRDLVDGDPLIVSREGTCCGEGRPVFNTEQ